VEHSHETRPPLRPLAVTNLRGRLHRGNGDVGWLLNLAI